MRLQWVSELNTHLGLADFDLERCREIVAKHNAEAAKFLADHAKFCSELIESRATLPASLEGLESTASKLNKTAFRIVTEASRLLRQRLRLIGEMIPSLQAAVDDCDDSVARAELAVQKDLALAGVTPMELPIYQFDSSAAQQAFRVRHVVQAAPVRGLLSFREQLSGNLRSLEELRHETRRQLESLQAEAEKIVGATLA